MRAPMPDAMSASQILADDGDRTVDRAASFRLLGSLLRPVSRTAWWTAGTVAIAQVMLALGPALVAYGIDSGLPALQAGRPAPALVSALTYLAVAILGGVLSAVTIRLAANVTQTMLLDLRGRLFRHTQRLDLEFHENYTSGRIISRQTSDTDALRELLDGGITTLAAGALSMLFTAVSLAWLDLRSGLVLLVALIPGALLTRWFQRRSRVQYEKQRTSAAKVIVRFVETLTGIRAVQAFRREPQEIEVFQELSGTYRDSNAEALRVNGVFDSGLTLIGNVTVAAVLLVGGVRVLDNGMQVGVLAAAVLYAKRFFSPLNQIGMLYNSFQSAVAALDKLAGLLAREPKVHETTRPVPLPRSTGDVVYDHVEFGYGDNPPVLSDFSLHIPAGQNLALVGETGAGKSTVAKLLARFYDVRGGAVRLDGVDLRDLSVADLRRAIVMVTQEAYLFSGSVADNIAIGDPAAPRSRIEAAARAVGIHEVIAAMPQGYDTPVDTRGVRLSAGQRQLVAFARALLAEPSVLVLDEATSSLDVPGEKVVQDGLRSLLTGRTAVIIAHRLSTVMSSDRVLVIDGGRIVEDGTPAELVAAGGRFYELYAEWQTSLGSSEIPR